MSLLLRGSALGALAMFCMSAGAPAQVPSTAAPGRLEERFRQPPAAQAAPEIQTPGPQAPLPPDQAAKIHFTLTAVTLEGNTVVRDRDLLPLYQSLLGKEITLLQLFDLRDAITARYRAAGYVLSQAIVPPQKIQGGVVHVRVIEGYVDHVTIKGDARDNRDLIVGLGEKIVRSRPLNIRDLERYVLLASDIPGLAVRTVLQPSQSRPGAAELIFVVSHKSVSGSAQIDNRGSVAIGPEQGQVQINANSILGLDEQASLMLATTARPRQLQYGQVGSAWILDTEGTTFTAGGIYSDSKPSGAIGALDAIGHSLTITGDVGHPFVRSRLENLRVGFGFEYLNTTTDLLGAKFSEDRLRYLTLKGTFDTADTLLGNERPATNVVFAELSQGLPVLDASRPGSPLLSRAGGHLSFTTGYVEGTRTQSMFEDTSLVLSVAGQIAGSTLLTPVQFGLGGSRFGRGYEPSELTGDNGVAGSVEARYDFASWLQPPLTPEFYAFYDVGEVWNIKPPAGSFVSASLASVGLGIRSDVFERLSVDFGFAKPLTRPIASRGNKDIRPLFSISTKF